LNSGKRLRKSGLELINWIRIGLLFIKANGRQRNPV